VPHKEDKRTFAEVLGLALIIAIPAIVLIASIVALALTTYQPSIA
jgi:hypothetical protein